MIARLEIQIEQLAASVRKREKGHSLVKLCPTWEDNLLLKMLLQASSKIGSDSNHEVQAIHILWSGKRVDNQVQAPPSNPNVVSEKEKENSKESTKKDDQVIIDNQDKSFVPKAPFPQRLQPTRKKNHC